MPPKSKPCCRRRKPAASTKRKAAAGKAKKKGGGAKRKLPKALTAWGKAARELGYMKKRSCFKPLPKKGTVAYKAIKRRADELKR